jgi:gamma-glutamyl-gamma-aminobutyrate hydrolase PuuD
VEWDGDGNWIVGVQWHPERMVGDRFSERLFGKFVDAARHRRETRRLDGAASQETERVHKG